MSIVPGWSLQLDSTVNAVLRSGDRENVPFLNPGHGVNLDKTYVTWFSFLHDLSQATQDIIQEGWVHEWPTYRFIPAHYKERWFLILARRNTWNPRHNLVVWTHFNLVARSLFWSQMRWLKNCWAHGGEKPEWMLTKVWLALVDMFEEFEPDNFGF